MVICPKCRRIIMNSTTDGGYKLRSRMVIFKDGKATALCPTCKTQIEVPIKLGDIDDSFPKLKIMIGKE